MGLKKISFLLKQYFFKTILVQKPIKIFRALIFFLSEFEAEIQTPGNFTPLRYLYLKLVKLEFGSNSYISRGIVIYNGHKIKLGKSASIGEKSMLHAHGNITIGDDFLAAPGLIINSGGHHINDLTPFGKDVKIGNRVWCGVRVTILAGVEIGNDVVIGACSVVTKDIPANSVAIGSPAKVVKTLTRENIDVWKWYQE